MTTTEAVVVELPKDEKDVPACLAVWVAWIIKVIPLTVHRL
ncbi:hypothetical protein ERO13_D09G195933v2 [Gossypium hirsutum]|nr:hypothetical protein ERO13_D09G195933v2 [Gossypium hirsutum]